MKEFYIWSVDADEAVGHFDTFSSDDGFVYDTVADAIAARDRGDDGMLHERLFRILRSAEEVEVPKLTWWRVYQEGSRKPSAYPTDVEGSAVVRIDSYNGHKNRYARVRARDSDDAVEAARQAWLGLTADLTGDAE